MTAIGADRETSPRASAIGPHRLFASKLGRQDRPRWERLGLLLLLTGTSCLYLVGLARSGWANGYYTAAVFAGSKSWSAMFFGSIDPANFISVDKPPSSLWPAELLARTFGLNPWTVLLPQAVEGIAAVALLNATVRRQAGALAGMLAGAALAVTPVCVLMFRFNNPDALLTLLMISTAYFSVRALEDGRTRWIVLVGAALGLAFLTKLLQALLIVPALMLPYLVAAPLEWRRKVRDVCLAGAAFVCASGWWVLAFALVPVSARPYVGSTQHNSIMELILGYNGLGRLTGREAGVSTDSSTSFAAGNRLFQGAMGNEISWFLPAAIIFSLAWLWSARRHQLTRHPASWSIWGTWLLLAGVELSVARGIVHPYYTMALAPPVAAVVGIGAGRAWAARDQLWPRVLLCVVGVVTAAWSCVPFSTAAGWNSWMRWIALLCAITSAAVLALSSRPKVALAAAAVMCVGSAALSSAWSVKTAMTAQHGAQPLAGPPVGTVVLHLPTSNRPTSDGGVETTASSPRARMGGLLEMSRPSPAMVTALKQNAASFTWVAATVGANNAAGIEIATRQPVMALGGFNATDPSPTLAEFQHLVAQRKVHYFVADAIQIAEGDSDIASRQIPQWVAGRFVATDFDSVRVYDLTAPLPSQP